MLIPKELIIEAKEKLGDKAAYIIAEEYKLNNWDEKNLKGSCPFGHSDSDPSFIWNPKENCFHCFSCGKNFGILDLYLEQGMSYLEATEKLFSLKDVNIDYKFAEKGLRANRDYKYPPYLKDNDRSKVEKYCNSRGISKETLDYCDVQEHNGLLIWNFYNENDALITVKCRKPKKIEKGEPKEWYLSDYDNTAILYNMNKIDPSQPLVITEGQFDTLAVIEAGYKNCVSVPGGTENLKWLENCYDWLETFSKIILWSDNDAAGKKMQKEVVTRLGSWRTLVVNLPPELEKEDGTKVKVKDANEVLYAFGKKKVTDLINEATDIPIQGVTDISDIEDFDIESAEGLYTQISEFDKIIYKFIFGSVCLVTGRPGSGKTSILNQIFVLEALNQNQDVFIFSGEMPKDVLRSWIDIQAAGRNAITMKDEHIRRIKPEVRKEIKDWYAGRVWFYDNDDDNNLDSILNKAENVIRRYGVKVVLLDNLMTIGVEANDTNIWQKQKELIVKLKSFANKFHVFVVLVAHPKKTMFGNDRLTGQDIAGSSDLFNLCQYCFSLRRFSEQEKLGEKDNKTGKYRKGKEPIEHDQEIEILKNRFTGTTGSFKMYFDKPSLRFYTNAKTLWKRYKWDKNTSPQRTDDPNEHKLIPEFMKD